MWLCHHATDWVFHPQKIIEALNKIPQKSCRGAKRAELSASRLTLGLTAHKIFMANLQCYIEEDKPSDNSETTINDNDESKELEDVNLIVSRLLALIGIAAYLV